MQCPTPISIKDPSQNKASQRVTVPCGKCGACRHNRRSDWSFRLKQELRNSISCYFITLTYCDETVPIVGNNNLTLVKKDLQDFLKRLRKHQAKYTSQKIRYYACGEYGTETNRPHYHIIPFNVHLRTVHCIGSLWNLGNIVTDPINDARIHYVTKHHVNKRESDEYGQREPEFTTMSRRPGIGANYIENARNWHRKGNRTYVINNGYKQRLPRYYAEKFFPKIIRDMQAEKTHQQSIENYNVEIERLSNLKVNDPDRYIHQSQMIQAKKVKHKAQEKDQI